MVQGLIRIELYELVRNATTLIRAQRALLDTNAWLANAKKRYIRWSGVARIVRSHYTEQNLKIELVRWTRSDWRFRGGGPDRLRPRSPQSRRGVISKGTVSDGNGRIVERYAYRRSQDSDECRHRAAQKHEKQKHSDVCEFQLLLLKPFQTSLNVSPSGSMRFFDPP
jgi:hypothetical protein